MAILAAPLAETLKHWKGPEFDLVEEGIPEAARRVSGAVGGTARTIRAPVTEDYTEALALLKARFGPIAAEFTRGVPLTEAE